MTGSNTASAAVWARTLTTIAPYLHLQVIYQDFQLRRVSKQPGLDLLSASWSWRTVVPNFDWFLKIGMFSLELTPMTDERQTRVRPFMWEHLWIFKTFTVDVCVICSVRQRLKCTQTNLSYVLGCAQQGEVSNLLICLPQSSNGFYLN